MAVQAARRPGRERGGLRRHGRDAQGAGLDRRVLSHAPILSSLSVVIVTHNHRAAVARSLPALARELREGDELIVVDNASEDRTPEGVRELAPAATVIEPGSNLGFAAGCNRGAGAATGELLCFLNPDAIPAAGWREAITAPLAEGRGWAAWQALVTAEDGAVVNTAGGEMHFTGVAWAGRAGEPVVSSAARGEPAFASGACFAVPRPDFAEAGGFAEEFFLYHEDVDLSLRLRLAGGRLGVAADARVDHDYDFEKGPAKWRYLERNRWATVLRTYPLVLLVLVWPALVATELALIPVAIAGGWFRQHVAAKLDVLRWLPMLLGERRRIQRERKISAADFAAPLRADLDSPYLGRAGRSELLRALLSGYWRAVLWALGGRRG